MFCSNCGAEISITENVYKSVITYCEACNHKISTMDLGEVSEEEWEWLRRSFQEKFEKAANGRLFVPNREILKKMGVKVGQNTRMHTPNKFNRPGRAVRISLDMKKGTA